jgi:hypothetical protein
VKSVIYKRIIVSLEKRERGGGYVFTAEFGWVAWRASDKQNMSMVHASRGSKNKIIWS